MGFMNRVRNFWGGQGKNCLPGGRAENAFGAAPAVSSLMRDNRNLWKSLYVNHPPWESREVRPLGLASAIGRELARCAMAEFSVSVSGGERAAFINEQMRQAGKNFAKSLELGLCLGGAALKPYPEGGKLLVDVCAGGFTPTKIDGTGKVLGGVFQCAPVKSVKSESESESGNQFFVRLEYHDFSNNANDENNENGQSVYIIRNKAFQCCPDGTPGPEVPLDRVPEWAGLQPETVIYGLDAPLFAYFNPPFANSVEPESKLGASVYAGASADLIRQADEQWRLIRWEYQSGKRRIYVDGVGAGQFDDEIFAAGPFSNNGNFFSVFSPDFRDDPLYNGFQRILQRIEFNTGLAYGSISDPQNVEKTATEILAARQRQYVTEKAVQKAFQSALEDLIAAMDAWCGLAGLAPEGEIRAEFGWGDGVLDDPETKRLDMSLDAQLVQLGVLRPWEFRMKWFGENEKTAKSRLELGSGLERGEAGDS